MEFSDGRRITPQAVAGENLRMRIVGIGQGFPGENTWRPRDPGRYQRTHVTTTIGSNLRLRNSGGRLFVIIPRYQFGQDVVQHFPLDA
jgi:hypothetical protein